MQISRYGNHIVDFANRIHFSTRYHEIDTIHISFDHRSKIIQMRVQTHGSKDKTEN